MQLFYHFTNFLFWMFIYSFEVLISLKKENN